MKKRIKKGSVLLITTVSIAVIFGVLGGSAAYFNNSLKTIRNEKNYIYRNVMIESRANEIVYDLSFNFPVYYFHPTIDLKNSIYKGAIDSFVITKHFGKFYAKNQQNLVIEDTINDQIVTINSSFVPDNFIDGENNIHIEISYNFSYLGKNITSNYESSYKLKKQTTIDLSQEEYWLTGFKVFSFKNIIIKNLEEE